eukprot:sb/3471172/
MLHFYHLPPPSGRITVYAETFENQTVMGTSWGLKGLSRPEFSNTEGTVSLFEQLCLLCQANALSTVLEKREWITLPQSAFKPPPGWEWGEDWNISLDFSSVVSADYGLNTYTDKMFEVDTREEGKGWSSATKKVIETTGGWDYAKTFSSRFHSGEMTSDIVRRRRWRRMLNSRNVGPVSFEVPRARAEH